MEKTYMNFVVENNGKPFCDWIQESLETSLDQAKNYNTSIIKYLFTLEINENGEGRIFKHELPKEPVKNYFSFWKNEKTGLIFTNTCKTYEDEKCDLIYLFTKCFDETGREYPIEEE